MHWSCVMSVTMSRVSLSFSGRKILIIIYRLKSIYYYGLKMPSTSKILNDTHDIMTLMTYNMALCVLP